MREELATIAPERGSDRLAELSALFHSAGSLHLRGAGAWGLHLDLGSGAAARRAFALLRESGIRSEIRTYRRRAFDTATRYQLHVAGDTESLQVLVDAGVVDRRHAPLERPPRRVVARSSSRAAYLRGAFLGAVPVAAKFPAAVAAWRATPAGCFGRTFGRPPVLAGGGTAFAGRCRASTGTAA